MEIPETLKIKAKEGDVKKLLSERPVIRLEIQPGMVKERKELLHFDKSLEVLKESGYDRHLMPWESFGLIIDLLENKLSGNLVGLVEDMLIGYGEWFNMAVERNYEELVFYTNPKNLKWNDKRYSYIIDGRLEFDNIARLDVTGFPSAEWADLKDLGDDFVEYFYTRKYKDLPKEMREGKDRATFYIPSTGCIWPIGRGSAFKFSIAPFDYVASRGIKFVKD